MRLCQWQQNSCFPQLQFDHQTLFKVSCSKHTLTRKVSWDKGEQRFSLFGHNDVFDWRNESWSSSRCYANYLASKLWQPHQKEVVGVFCFCCFFRKVNHFLPELVHWRGSVQLCNNSDNEEWGWDQECQARSTPTAPTAIKNSNEASLFCQPS